MAFLLVLAGAGSAVPAQAEPTANEIAVARQLFKEATDLEGHQRWAEAAAKLRAAIAIKDTPGLRFHLAHAEVEQGQFVEALVDYDRADELIRAGASAPDVVDVLAEARNAARQRVATLTLHVQADAAGAELTLDGKPVARELLEQPIPLNPGTHDVKVSAVSRKPFVHRIQLSDGERRDLEVVLEPARPSPATASGAATPTANSAFQTGPSGTTPDASRTSNLKLVLVVGETALVAVGVAVGIGFSIAKSGALERADRTRSKLPVNACNPSVLAQQPMYRNDCRTLSDSLHDADRDQSLAVGGFVGAGLAGAAALATGLLWHPERRASASALSPIAVAANVTQSGFDLKVRASF